MKRALLAALAALAMTACQTDRITSSDGRRMPAKPRPAPAVPASAVPGRMMLLVGQPEDTDGNGFPDLIRVETALFAPPHATGIPADGAFVFAFYRPGESRRSDAKPLAEWRFAGDEVADARGVSFLGTTYRLRLRLLDVFGTDELPTLLGDLRGRYEPAEGDAVVYASDEFRPVRLGRSMSDR